MPSSAESTLTLHTCPLCGHRFDAGALTCHEQCPLGRGCNLVCCPACGYETVDETSSRLARRLARVGRVAGGRRDAAPRALSEVPAGVPARIHDVTGISADQTARLSTLGFVPGSPVEVLQHRPLPIVRIGAAEVAMEVGLLTGILVTLGG